MNYTHTVSNDCNTTANDGGVSPLQKWIGSGGLSKGASFVLGDTTSQSAEAEQRALTAAARNATLVGWDVNRPSNANKAIHVTTTLVVRRDVAWHPTLEKE